MKGSELAHLAQDAWPSLAAPHLALGAPYLFHIALHSIGVTRWEVNQHRRAIQSLPEKGVVLKQRTEAGRGQGQDEAGWPSQTVLTLACLLQDADGTSALSHYPRGIWWSAGAP